jgi:hypothetical protein
VLGIVLDERLKASFSELGSDSVVEKDVFAGLTSMREVSKDMSTVFGWVILVVPFSICFLGACRASCYLIIQST